MSGGGVLSWSPEDLAPDWQSTVVWCALGGLTVADPNPFPALRIWRWWP